LSIDRKRSMHVQSISHWAPANIGPYSQCVQVCVKKLLNKINKNGILTD
jgi:hypothetical protein